LIGGRDLFRTGDVRHRGWARLGGIRHGDLTPQPAAGVIVAQVMDAPGFEAGTEPAALGLEDHVLGETDAHQSAIADGGGA